MAPPLLLSVKRPKNVDELINRIRDTEIDAREKEALDALVKSMIAEFRAHANATYYVEASRISEITTGTQYEDLINIFTNNVIENSTKGYVPDRDLLPAFDHCLRQHHGRSSERFLVSALGDLREGLNHAMEKADLQSQYRFLHVLGTVLDVAMDIHLEGIDREKIHQPLSDTLRGLRKHSDPRISQAATYAYEALRGIPNNEGPMDVFFRTSGTVISATAKIASSVASMDPGKALSAVPDILEIVGYCGKLLESLQNIKEGTTNLKNALLQDIRRLPKQHLWYSVLRFTGPLIAAHEISFELLKDAIPELPCRDDWRFWCGLYDQLEQVWMDGDQDVKGRIITFTEWTLDQPALKHIRSTDEHVHDWINLISETFNRPQWIAQAPGRRRDRYFRFLVKEKSKKTGLQRPFQQGKTGENTGGLFDTAWPRCIEAHRLYMDAGIAQHYQENDLLKIFRLSGERLEMRNCYINLSLIEATIGREKSPEVLDLSLRKRLQIDAPSEGRDIQLQDLYKERQLRNGMTGIPKRILIRGRAGVGKTTLCKKIVHDFIHGQLSSWKVDRVLWIPLRKLKGKNDPERFLCEELSARNEEKEIISKSLSQTIDDAKTRTLFLLDGFDEIAGEVVSNDNLRALLNRNNVIVTSRPHAIDPFSLDAFDLELETVGFRTDQVKQYVSHVYAGNQNLASDIQEFVKGHWLIGGLLQIPIQLDALCYTWEENPLSKDITTMTALYQAIEVKLWRKDMAGLGKCDHSKVNDYWDRSQISRLMGDEMDLLERFAFNGLANNLVEFGKDHRKTLYKTLPGKAGETDSTLKELSFLRTSSEDENKTYYFIHLTFQEYFAACYFVRCWIKQQQLVSVSLESGDLSSLQPEEFLRQEKYNGRYNIMWRFVSGLLSSKREKQYLTRFLQAMDGDPKDLLGQAHLQILMHCFNETSVSENDMDLANMKQDLELRLSRQNLISLAVDAIPSLADQMEFPEAVLKYILEKGSTLQKERVVRALFRRTQISSNLFQQVEALKVSGSVSIKLIGETLGRHWSVSPERFMEILNSRDTSTGMISGILEGLWYQTEITDDILRLLISRLADSGDSESSVAAVILRDQSSLSPHIVADMAPLLQDKNPRVRVFGVRGLCSHQLSHEAAFHGILNLYNDRDENVRVRVADALGYTSDRPEVLEPLGNLVKDENKNVRRYAAMSLAKQQTLPQEALDSLYNMIEDPDDRVKEEALSAWAKHCTSPELVTQKLFSKLDGSILGYKACECLRKQSLLPDDFEKPLLPMLQTGTFFEKLWALDCLRSRTNLDNETLGVLYDFISLADHTDLLWSSAIEIVRNQTNFPDSALKPLAAFVAERDSSLKGQAIDALGRHKTLPEDILKSLVSHMDNEFSVEYSAWVLYNQHSLPTTIMHQVISLLNNQSGLLTRLAAERVLRDHHDFPKLLGSLDRKTWTVLMQIWFKKSLEETLICYRSEDCLILTTPQQTCRIHMATDSQKDILDHVFRKLEQSKSKVPALGDTGTFNNIDELFESEEDEDLYSDTEEDQHPTSSPTSKEDENPDSPAASDEDPNSSPTNKEDENLDSPAASDEDQGSSTTSQHYRAPDSRTVAVEHHGSIWLSFILPVYFFCFSVFIAFLAA